MANGKDSIRKVDENGVVRYHRPPGPHRYAPSRNPRILSDAQIDNKAVVTEEELSEVIGGVSVHNILKGKRHSQKIREARGGPRSLDAMLRRAKALELRRAGFSWDEIANRKSLGYDNGRRAQRDVMRLLSQMIDTPAQEVLALELSRLDAITQALWQQVRNGELAAVDRLLNAMRMRQELLGLHKINITQTVVTVSELDKEIERLTADMKKYDEGSRDQSGTSISDREELEAARKAAGL